MCGRYVVEDNENAGEMKKILSELKRHYSDTQEYRRVKTGEIFPSDTAPVIIPAKADRIDAVPMRWGFEHQKSGNLVINARSEKINESYMFRNSIVNKRCIIPTNGFYEWQKFSDGRKSEKYLIKSSDNPMLYLAGIYSQFIDKNTGKEQTRFVIITRESRGVIRSLHSRMPVYVEKKDILKWLNGYESHVYEIFNGETPDYLLKNISAQTPGKQQSIEDYRLM